MVITLKSKQLEVKISEPLEGYQSSRFDWTGKVSEIFFKGVPITTNEAPNCTDPLQNGAGLYNEFSMHNALGFDDTEIGSWFHKIGVGLLKKHDYEYDFSKVYEIQPAKFDMLVEVDRVHLECISPNVNGYSYHLQKEIIVEDDQLIINYSLENTGQKEIHTEEYVHNFFCINHALIDSNYELKLPFQIKRPPSCKTINPNNILDFKNDEIKFTISTEHQFFADYLNGNNIVHAGWELINRDTKIGVSETASFKTSKVNLWGWKHVISPELFHSIHLKPTQIEEWTRTYHFFTLE
jgi:hypothetical protein